MEANVNFPFQTDDDFNSVMKFQNIENKVFNNDVVMRRLLGFLDFENLRKCRLVCTSWRNFCDYRFRKIAKIEFDDNKFYSTRKTQNLDIFFQNPQSTIPFTACQFEGTCRSFIHFKKVLFFKQSRKFVKELTLKNVTFTHKGNTYNSIVDLGLIPSMISVLRIAQLDYGSAWTVSLETLVSIQILDLENCTVVLPIGNWKIFPMKLRLKNILFSREGKKVESALINEFVDFWRIETLDLDGRFDKRMSIDLCDFPAFDILTLSYVKILNWGQSVCKVKKMILKGIPYLQKNANLVVNELKVDCSTVELSSLPNTLEKLQLSRNNVTCTSSDPIVFPNVKFLKYSKNEIDPLLASIPNLDIFVNLVDISLSSPCTPIPLDVNSFPKVIKRMKLDNIMIIGEGLYQLETLIIKNGYWIDVRKLLEKLEPSHLVIYRKRYDSLFRIRDVERILILIRKPFQSITLGKMEWRDDEEFVKSNLSQFADRKAEYYIFTEQKGKAISEQEFNTVVKF